MPHFPPLGNVVCVDARRVPELAEGANAISAWCEDTLQELDPRFGPPNRFLSDVLAYLDMSFRIHRQSYISKLHTRKLKISEGHDFINFYDRKSPDVISRAIRAVQHILFKSLAIEANVLVNIVELIGRETIVQWRIYQRGKNSELVFDQLLVPWSWAFDMVKRPPLPQQNGIVLRDFMVALSKALELLHDYEPSSSPLYGLNGPLGLLIRSVLITRICRLMVLVANNVAISTLMKEEIRQAIARSITGSGNMHTILNLCTKFLTADSWHDLWNAVRFSPLNRGADRLVYLSRRRDDYKPPTVISVESIVYCNIPELERLLSLVEPGAVLDSRVEPFVPQTQNHVPRDDEDTTEPIQTSTAVDDKSKTGEFPDLVTSEGDLTLASWIEPKRSLTASEIESGKKILSRYRQYALRQRMKNAVEAIWACYLRYRLRHNAPITETEEELRKLHDEYKNDVESIDCPLLCIRAFKSHERILLGFMPHVLVYLCGLERINQQEKEATMKRLQTATRAELDGIRIRMDVCFAWAKKIKTLILHIAPGSCALRRIDTLREGVKQVDLLRSEIMHTFGEDAIPKSLEEHYALGIPMILPTSGNNVKPAQTRT
ncbi:hypothetical protein RSAG8_09799, partial [Rhizoctonia solani AG-8 WAC10335]